MGKAPRQLSLDLPVEPRFGREEFLLSPSNEVAHEMIERWPDWPDRFLLLVGPGGAGKSHLAHIWAEAAGARVLPGALLANADPMALAAAGAILIEDADQARHLKELTRVVKPGGHVCVFEHNPYNPVTKRIFERAPIDRGCHMIPPPRLQRLFVEAGLTTIERGFLLFLPEPLWKWLGFVEPLLSWLPLGGQYFVSGRKASAS